MKAQDMKNMTAIELQAHHDALLDELVNLRVKLVLRQLENPLQVRALRREIARAKTFLTQIQAAGGRAATGPTGKVG
jgi:large subunit ribosomal protein L29